MLPRFTKETKLNDFPGLCTDQIEKLSAIKIETIGDFLNTVNTDTKEIIKTLDVSNDQIDRFSNYVIKSIIETPIPESIKNVIHEYGVELNQNYNSEDSLGEISRYHVFLANIANASNDVQLNYTQESSFIRDEVFWIERSLYSGSINIEEALHKMNIISLDVLRLYNRTDAPPEAKEAISKFVPLVNTVNEIRNNLLNDNLTFVENYPKILTQFNQVQSLTFGYQLGTVSATTVVASSWATLAWGIWDKIKKVLDFIKRKGDKVSKKLWAILKKLVLIIEFIEFVWHYGRTVAACYTYCGTLHDLGSGPFWQCVSDCFKDPSVAGDDLEPVKLSDAIWDALKILGVHLFLELLDDPVQKRSLY